MAGKKHTPSLKLWRGRRNDESVKGRKKDLTFCLGPNIQGVRECPPLCPTPLLLFVGPFPGRTPDQGSTHRGIYLHGQESAYLTIWEGLTLHQRKTIKAAAFLGGRLLSAKETIQHFNLEAASNVGKSLRSFCSKGILRREKEGYVFEDVLFGQWIKKNA